MVEIAGGIVLAVFALCGIVAAIVWWPVTVAIAVFIAITAWLNAHGLI